MKSDCGRSNGDRELSALIAEDNEQCAEVMCLMLRHAGFNLDHTVVAAEQPMRGALLAQRWDVVISDFHMPGFSGTVAWELVKELAPATPFVLVTSDPSPSLFERFAASGVWACCDKAEFDRVVDLLVQRFLKRAAYGSQRS